MSNWSTQRSKRDCSTVITHTLNLVRQRVNKELDFSCVCFFPWGTRTEDVTAASPRIGNIQLNIHKSFRKTSLSKQITCDRIATYQFLSSGISGMADLLVWTAHKKSPTRLLPLLELLLSHYKGSDKKSDKQHSKYKYQNQNTNTFQNTNLNIRINSAWKALHIYISQSKRTIVHL